MCVSIPADIFEKMASQIDDEALSVECQGGGRICVDPGTRTITISGYSQVSFVDFLLLLAIVRSFH